MEMDRPIPPHSTDAFRFLPPCLIQMQGRSKQQHRAIHLLQFSLYTLKHWPLFLESCRYTLSELQEYSSMTEMMIIVRQALLQQYVISMYVVSIAVSSIALSISSTSSSRLILGEESFLHHIQSVQIQKSNLHINFASIYQNYEVAVYIGRQLLLLLLVTY